MANNYKVQVYLGKENYTRIKGIADLMGISVPTMTKIILNTGLEISQQLERRVKESGKQQSKE